MTIGQKSSDGKEVSDTLKKRKMRVIREFSPKKHHFKDHSREMTWGFEYNLFSVFGIETKCLNTSGTIFFTVSRLFQIVFR